MCPALAGGSFTVQPPGKPTSYHFDTCRLILHCPNMHHSELQPMVGSGRYIQTGWLLVNMTTVLPCLMCMMVVRNIKSRGLRCQKGWGSAGGKPFRHRFSAPFAVCPAGHHDRGRHRGRRGRCPAVRDESSAGADREVQVSAPWEPAPASLLASWIPGHRFSSPK